MRAWQRLPVLIRAVLSGGALGAAGTITWALLAGANLRYLNTIPWALLPTAAFLWFFWRYTEGEGWPRSTAEARRTLHRANSLSGEVWGAALLAGMLGLFAVLLMQGVMNRMVRLPQQEVGDLAGTPGLTVAGLLLMSAVVSGIVEESAFRGYMQAPIEKRHGPAIAILVTGTLFGFAHFTHPEVTMVLMPYYIAVAAAYGMLAYLTNSILPCVVLHAGGNVFTSLDLIGRGNSEWQASATPAPLIWETGADAPFWGLVAAFLVVGALAVGAYVSLARSARALHQAGANQAI